MFLAVETSSAFLSPPFSHIVPHWRPPRHFSLGRLFRFTRARVHPGSPTAPFPTPRSLRPRPLARPQEIYQKKTQLEHILLRPDTYVGSVDKLTAPMWVHEASADGGPAGGNMVQRNVTYVPGLYKIFDEILVNAADNRARDATMDTLRVDIDPAAGSIRVYNNGAGVPVQMHAEERVYVPELIFGHLLTSSNYDDKERKVTGGRNGYGAKLANIFSTEFVVETCDGSRSKRYRQVFRDNMGVKGNPEITACKPTENWTCISFKPDLAKARLRGGRALV